MTTTINTSTGAFFDRAKTNLASLRSQAEALQQQLSTGTTLTSASDDPVAASRLRHLQRADRLAKIDMGNVDRANSDLALADTALNSFATYIDRAKELATWASSNTLSDAQRTSIGDELAQIREGVLALANSRDSQGFALFGGGSSAAAYTTDASGNATYAGTSQATRIPIGDGQSVTTGLTGPAVLGFAVGGAQTDLLSVLKTLTDGVKAGAADPAGAARDALAGLDAGLQTVTTQQTIVGARMSWLDVMTDHATKVAEQRASEEADVGGIDIAATTVDLQRALLVLQASQASFTKLSSLTLFNT